MINVKVLVLALLAVVVALVAPSEAKAQGGLGCFICECEEGNCNLQDCEDTGPDERWGDACTEWWEEGTRWCNTHGDPCFPRLAAAGRLLPSELSSMGTYFTKRVLDRIRMGATIDGCTGLMIALLIDADESPTQSGVSFDRRIVATLEQ